MGSGLSVDADAESAYSFIACAEFCAKRTFPSLARELRKSHIGVRVSRSALLHTRRREIAMIREIPDTDEMEAAEMHVLKRGIEFERALEESRIVIGDTLLHIAARSGSVECVDYLLMNGFDNCILSANGRGEVPSEAATSRATKMRLDDLALVIEVAGQRFSLQNIAWQVVASARRVFGVWHYNSLHECGCIVRALCGLKRSDEQFLLMTRIVAAEAKRAGVAVHREGLKIGYDMLDATYNDKTKTYDPTQAEENFQALPVSTIDHHCRVCFDYCFWSDPYWESRYSGYATPEPFRIELYREWIMVAVRYWIQIALSVRREEINVVRKEEDELKQIEVEKKMKIKQMLADEKKGVEREEGWVAEVEHEPNPVEIYIQDKKSLWKRLYSKSGKIPTEMKQFFRENGLKKSKAKQVLGIDPGASLKIDKAQMKMAILGHNPLERAVWGARLSPPGRSEVVSADIGCLREFTGMPELIEARVQRTEGEDGVVIEQLHDLPLGQGIDDNVLDHVA
jgi:hypothetical protein